jgi:hypothetical protein
VHGAEAPKIYGTGEAQLGRGCLDVAQQITPPQSPAFTLTFTGAKHPIVRLPVLARIPSPNHSLIQQQASLLAFLACFWILGIIAFCSAGLNCLFATSTNGEMLPHTDVLYFQ